MGKRRLPLDVYRQLNVKERVPLKREAKITLYKDQALVHFPSVITSELNIRRSDKFEITVEKPVTVICRLKRGKS